LSNWKKYSIIIGAIILLIVFTEIADNYPILWWIGLLVLIIFLFLWLDNAAFGEEIFNLIMLCLLGGGLLFFAYLVYPEGMMDHAFAGLTREEIGRFLLSIMLVISFIADVGFIIHYIYKVLK
jgi:hypothetical protein